MLKFINTFTKKNIILIMKIILIYILLLTIFYSIHNKTMRFVYTSLIYLLCIYLFNIECKMSILYVILAISAVVTESIYINFFKDTWKYADPDIISIPYWLIAIWSVAILLLVECVNMVK